MTDEHSQSNRRIDRRTVLKTGAALGTAAMLPVAARPAVATDLTSPGFGLDDLEWQDVDIEDAIPDVMASSGTRRGVPYYRIEMAPGMHQHHPAMDPTPVWGYKGPNDEEGQYPGKTIEGRVNQPMKVEFVNELPESHLFDVDTEVHGTKLSDYSDRYPEWTDQFADSSEFPEVRAVTHAHGLHVESASDGLPEQWTSPDGIEGPQFVKDVYDYTNRQDPATLWYHDHALGLTRLNVYAGLAGFFLLRGPQEERLGLPSGDKEVPILFQDRAFDGDPDDDAPDRYQYPSSFEAEVSGDVSVVNGQAWPRFSVDPGQYRFRFLNGSNGRFFNVRLESEDGEDPPTMYQIGTDLGFLRDVVPIGPDEATESLLLGPAERADVVVDFSDFAGETLTVTNDADFPFQSPGASTGTDGAGLPELAQFTVRDETPQDPAVDPTSLRLPGPEVLKEEAAVQTRRMGLDTGALNGLDTHFLDEEGGRPAPGEHWGDPVLTKPQLGTTEVWELENRTGDAHPIHLHLVDFQVLGRGPNGTDAPEPTERGNKDTVNVYAGETVRIASRFGNFAGRYVWHCHILEHEDQEMMRPYEVVTGGSNE
ncbi:multicopper oxidase domain-containing protein [Halogeometricum sp. S1BR25-6]|uniref:Multicopper oxidase domain-containing protein n=1 Tax=Halogeometricum salsisoli TaxID=2950536 RepID=A0ABU2GGM5_9EURY|nr:multicopper oxidase domain-containing protein [Halogeometricum sp. S1BR25-6]MDS0299319.1 multicopper oxidase domain-containing protein [Halogeometricum sp. S1BR25-6]